MEREERSKGLPAPDVARASSYSGKPPASEQRREYLRRYQRERYQRLQGERRKAVAHS